MAQIKVGPHSDNDSPSSSSSFELCSTPLLPFVFSFLCARPFDRDISGRSNEKRNSLLRCCTPQLFAEVHHLSREVGVNIQQDPVVGVSLPKRTTIGEAPGHLYSKSMSP